jgi:tetratricopeptide (TPR) repeat protein
MKREGGEPSLSPGFSAALITRVVTACEGGDYDSAIADLTSALSTAAWNPDLLYNRGLVLEATGRCDEAISDYTRALRITGSDRAELLYRRGRCHLALGRTEDATCDLKAHLAIGESPYEQEIADLLGIQPYRTQGPSTAAAAERIS